MPEQPTTSDSTAVPEQTHSRLEVRQVFAKLPAQHVERARDFCLETFGLQAYSEHNNHLHYEIDGGYFIVYPSRGAPPALMTNSASSSMTSKPPRPSYGPVASPSRTTRRRPMRPNAPASPTSAPSRPPGSKTPKAT
ncbi:MAG TPA: hypothetical protein VJ741_18605 [Solirubrobacteraceae bacterium]|nr:hypothetical protein [Solirubrobacteraceae bacterium]